MNDVPNNRLLRVIGVIPARYGSTRFPGKVIADIHGKAMIQWVYERAVQSKMLEKVIIATDDNRVKTTAEDFGAEVVMTAPEHASGTDRIAEAIADTTVDVVVNIQGDEPLIDPEAIDDVIAPFYQDETVNMTSLYREAETIEEIFNPNTVRVVFDQNKNALYFSRATIPFSRVENAYAQLIREGTYYLHIGVYAYRKEFLLFVSRLPQTRLEKIEKLEQLRVLEAGYKIRMVGTDYKPVCVDVPADRDRVDDLMKFMGRLND